MGAGTDRWTFRQGWRDEAAMRNVVPLERHLILLRMLCARRHGMTVREMARELGVDQKTIRRYLNRFRSVGFPLVEAGGEHGRPPDRRSP
jgi:predicted DNA-binding transcriptional regulator YafY